MSETKTVHKLWWAWNPEKIEKMLEDMAAEGWVLIRCDALLLSFTLEKRDPVRIRYCADYQDREKPEYLALLQDAGWMLEHKGSGWYIWSMAYEGERPELYTDVDSLIRRSNAILGSLTAVFAAQIPLLTINLQNMWGRSPAAIILLAIWGFVFALMAGMIIGTALGINKLKRRKKAATGK